MRAVPSPCPKCGAPLVPGTLDGLCPRCLARGVFVPADGETPFDDGEVGGQIGPYTLLENRGKSGGATGWLAASPRARGKVLLRIFPPCVDLALVCARAARAHPQPPAVLDRGTTEWGRPYLVTEWHPGKADPRPPSPLRRFVLGHPRACAAAVVLVLVCALGLHRQWRGPATGRAAADPQPRPVAAATAPSPTLTPRQRYAADIRRAAQALDARQPDRARQLLDAHRPAPGGEDLRGWEWRWLWQQLRSPAAGRQLLAANVVFAFLLPGGQTAYVVETPVRRYLLDLATLDQTPLPLTAPGLGLFAPPNFLGFHDGVNGLALYEVSAHGAARIGVIPVGALAPDAMAYAPATRTLAWAVGGTALHVTDLDRPTESFELGTSDGPALPACFDATGRFLLGTGPQGEARVWDVTGRRRRPPAEAYFSPGCLAVFPTLRNALGSRSLAAWITAATQSAILQQPSVPADYGPPNALTARAFSPDGRTFAVATERGRVALFDAVRQEKIATLQTTGPPAAALAFSPDGTRLVRAGGPLWDVASGEELLRLPAGGAPLAIAQFSDDGGTLLIGAAPQPGGFQFHRAPSWEEIAAAETPR